MSRRAVPGSAGPGRPFVSVRELAERLSGPEPPVVLDVRWRLGGPPGDQEYAAGHVPGASYVDLERDLADPPRADRHGGRHPLPDPQRFGGAMRRVGVSVDRPVVVYDDAAGTSAARCWWLLSHYGHDDVTVLDGGWGVWVAAGRPVGSGPAGAAGSGDWEPRPGRYPLVDAAGAARLAGEGVLLDARAPERFRGEKEPVDPVAGHVPGAVSAPTTAWIGPDGLTVGPDEVHRRLDALGARPGNAVGAYCGSGVTAAHTVLVLASAGRAAALYAGSWSDWIADPDRPVETGAADGYGLRP